MSHTSGEARDFGTSTYAAGCTCAVVIRYCTAVFVSKVDKTLVTFVNLQTAAIPHSQL